PGRARRRRRRGKEAAGRGRFKVSRTTLPEGRVMARRSLLFLGAVVALSLLTGADWPRFRGPNGSGISAETDLPASWSEKEGLLWKAELPGPGSSSPIVLKGK